MPQEIEALKKRVEALEAVVFVKAAKPERPEREAKSKKQDFSGATGGIRFLVASGYFKSARRFGEITAALEDKGYLYSKQAFQIALNRLSKAGGPLTTIRKDRGKVYAQRK